MEKTRKIKYTTDSQADSADILNENKIRLIAEKQTRELQQQEGENGKSEEYTEWL